MKKSLTRIFLVLTLTIVLVSGMSMSASACTTSYFPFTWANGSTSISMQIFSSAYSDYYTKLNNNYTSWNGISSKASLGTLTYNSNGTNSNKDIEIHGQNLTGSLYGYVELYSKNILGIVTDRSSEVLTYTGTIFRAKVYLDTRQSGSVLSLSDSWIVHNVMHELGHCLALSHPGCTNSALMHQTASSYVSTSITTHDKNNLKAKWGN